MGKRIRYLCVPLICGLIFLAGCSHNKKKAEAYHNEPKGFRGLFWGETIFNLKNFSCIKQDGAHSTYVRLGDTTFIDKAKTEAPRYFFYKDRLYAASITFEELANYKRIKNQLFFLYGPATPQSTIWIKKWAWLGDRVNIQMKYYATRQKGFVKYTYKPISIEAKADRLYESHEGLGDL